MENWDYLKNIFQVVAGDDQRVKQLMKAVEIKQMIDKGDDQQDILIRLVTAVDPKLTPIINLLKNPKEGNNTVEKPFVQYNRPQ